MVKPNVLRISEVVNKGNDVIEIHGKAMREPLAACTFTLDVPSFWAG
jgi:hypothetical protein